jgi:cytoskeleton protein RodZ
MAKVTRLSFDKTGGPDGGSPQLRSFSEDLNSPLETIGHDLRAAREGFGLDLEAVSRALKIRVEHLAALEESNSEGLPGRPYAIGFVRSYASYLGLDPVRSGERFKAEIAGRGNNTEAELTYPTSERRLPQGVVVVLLLLLAAAVVYGGYYLVISAGRVAEPPVIAVPDRLAVPAPEPLLPITPEGAVPVVPEAVAAAPEAALPTPEAAAADAPAPVAAPEPEPVIVETAPPAPQRVVPVPAPRANETAPPAPQQVVPVPATRASETAPPAPQRVVPVPSPRAYGTRNLNSRVTLRARFPARLLVRGPDNTVFLNRTLAPGDLYQVPNLVGLRVTTTDSGAVEVILDGAFLGVLGRRGAAASGLSLNPQDLVDRTGGRG